MARGRLEPPNLDDRTWQDIVDQARALIPHYAREWTDTSPSDPGMTLVELFAWIVEGMIYRLNQVPERNYVAFLNLIGITRDPATPASTMLQFWTPPGATQPVPMPAGVQVTTTPTETQPAIMFETDESLTVLPSRLVEAHVSTSDASPMATIEATTALVAAPLSGKQWSLRAGGSISLFLGFDALIDAATAPRLGLHVRLTEMEGFGRGIAADEGTLTATWSYRRRKSDNTWEWAKFAPDTVWDETSGLRRSGRVAFPTPADWTLQTRADWTGQPPDPAGQGNATPRAWLRLTLSFQHTDAARETRLRLDHLLFNAVRATNAPTERVLGPAQAVEIFTSTGKPFQRFELKQRPLYRAPGQNAPFSHLQIEVRSPLGQDEVWDVAEELPPTARPVLRVLPVTGSIEFGDGQRGMIPPAGSLIRVLEYRAVGSGAAGNVASGLVTKLHWPADLSGKVEVDNPGPAQGGADEEPIEETKRRGPEALRNRSRAVTADDYEYLAREASTAVAKVRCLSAVLEPAGTATAFYGGIDRGPGHVTVLIVPKALDDPSPRPSTELIRDVQNSLGRLRVVTTALTVTGPRYLPVAVELSVRLFPKATAARTRSRDEVETELHAAIEQFLHPLKGGPLRPGSDVGDGWEIGQHLFISGLFERVQTIIGHEGFIERLAIAPAEPDYVTAQGNPGAITLAPLRPPIGVLGRIALDPSVGISVADFELIRSAGAAGHQIDVQELIL